MLPPHSTGDGAYPDCGPWALRQSPSDRFPPTSPATRLGFFRSEQILPIQAPIYAAMLILNGLWVWEARMLSGASGGPTLKS